MNPYLPYSSDATLFVCIILGLITFRRLTITGKLVLLQLAIAVLTEATAVWITKVRHQPNLWIYNGYILVEFLVLLAAGYHLHPTRKARRILLWCAPLFIGIWIANIVLMKPGLLAIFSFVAGCTGLSAYYLWQQINLLKISTHSYPNMLIGLGVIIYFACSIPVYSFYNYFLDSDQKVTAILYNSRHILSIVRYGIIGFSYLILLRRTPNYRLR